MVFAFRTIFLAIVAVAMVVTAPIKAMNPRKLDDTTPANTNPVGSPEDQIKCGSCPCGQTCYTSPPPPPPPSPSPPPPAKKPSPTPGLNCPPPPSGGGGGGGGAGGGGGGGGGKSPPDYIYITGPPGDLYPVVQSVSDGRRSFTVAPSLLVFSGLLLGILCFW